MPQRAPSRAFNGVSLTLILGLLAHAASLYLAVISADGVRFGFAHILSAASWIGVGLLWLEGDGPHTGAMRTMVLPVAALVAPLPLLFPGASIQSLAARPLFVPHMVVGIFAYAVMLLAVVHATVMAMAERSLHRFESDSPSGIRKYIDRLPPLLTLERILFRLLGIGFILLTLTAISGLFFSEEVFGQSLRWNDHKTVLTLLAWVVFGVLLAGRYIWGWRGRLALRLTVAGYLVMLLGYAGSRFVLEVILKRIA